MSVTRSKIKDRHFRAYLFGLGAEWLACLWLILHGYRILERNYAAAGGEIDIIARRGKSVCFIEVKARPTLDEARTAISFAKQKRLIRTIAHWQSQHLTLQGYDLRADAIYIAPWRWPLHAQQVFDLNF